MIQAVEYQRALDYIFSFTDYEKMPGIIYTSANYDLRRMQELLESSGNPHQAARSVHVAGTKGKGSAAAMIAAVLSASGYRTGLFTSPHLHDLRERIRIDGEPISEEELALLVEGLRPRIDAINLGAAHGQLTTFEILTALAFAFFERSQVDFQVLEVGLGGRLDATNLVKPEVCVITSISLDHVEVLGDSLAQIAAEKAGIIKPGSTVVSSPQPAEAALVVEEVCHKKGAALIKVGSDITWQRGEASLSGQSFTVKGRAGSYYLTIPLLGDHQLENAAVAVAALEVLAGQGTKVTPESLATGLAGVYWPGRLQVLLRQPLLIADGAHNADSARRLKAAITQYFDFQQSILILGTSADKNVAGIVAELAPLCHRVIVTRSCHPRAAAPSVLEAELARQGIKAEMRASVPSAVSSALAMAGEKDLICATGSLFVVAEVIEYIKGRQSS